MKLIESLDELTKNNHYLIYWDEDDKYLYLKYIGDGVFEDNNFRYLLSDGYILTYVYILDEYDKKIAKI